MLNIKLNQSYKDFPDETRAKIEEKFEWINSLPRDAGTQIRIEFKAPEVNSVVIIFSYEGLAVMGAMIIDTGWKSVFSFRLENNSCEIYFL